jgi:hypothetical protein
MRLEKNRKVETNKESGKSGKVKKVNLVLCFMSSYTDVNII